jgi:hypothetical protein
LVQITTHLTVRSDGRHGARRLPAPLLELQRCAKVAPPSVERESQIRPARMPASETQTT